MSQFAQFETFTLELTNWMQKASSTKRGIYEKHCYISLKMLHSVALSGCRLLSHSFPGRCRWADTARPFGAEEELITTTESNDININWLLSTSTPVEETIYVRARVIGNKHGPIDR